MVSIAVVKFTLSEIVWRENPSSRDPTFLDTEVNFCNKKITRFSVTPEHVFFKIMFCFETRVLFEVLRKN